MSKKNKPVKGTSLLKGTSDLDHLRKSMREILDAWEHRIDVATRSADEAQLHIEQWRAVADSRQREIDRLQCALAEANDLLRQHCRDEAAKGK